MDWWPFHYYSNPYIYILLGIHIMGLMTIPQYGNTSHVLTEWHIWIHMAIASWLTWGFKPWDALRGTAYSDTHPFGIWAVSQFIEQSPNFINLWSGLHSDSNHADNLQYVIRHSIQIIQQQRKIIIHQQCLFERRQTQNILELALLGSTLNPWCLWRLISQNLVFRWATVPGLVNRHTVKAIEAIEAMAQSK